MGCRHCARWDFRWRQSKLGSQKLHEPINGGEDAQRGGRILRCSLDRDDYCAKGSGLLVERPLSTLANDPIRAHACQARTKHDYKVRLTRHRIDVLAQVFAQVLVELQ